MQQQRRLDTLVRYSALLWPFFIAFVILSLMWTVMQWQFASGPISLGYPPRAILALASFIGLIGAAVILIARLVARLLRGKLHQKQAGFLAITTRVTADVALLLATIALSPLLLAEVGFQAERAGEIVQAKTAFEQFARALSTVDRLAHGEETGQYAANWLIATARDFSGKPISGDLLELGFQYLRQAPDIEPILMVDVINEYAAIKERNGKTREAEALYQESEQLFAMQVKEDMTGRRVVALGHAEQIFKRGGGHNMRRTLWRRFYHPAQVSRGGIRQPAYYLVPTEEYNSAIAHLSSSAPER